MPATDCDVCIIGGGIHGVGVAQAAAAAGHRALVLEKTVLAFGSSRRSSKLIHGGLRYLESGQLRLVRESLRERELLLRIAPDLVELVPFHIPVYATNQRRPALIRLGLTLYAVLGNLNRHSRFETLPRSAWDDLDGLATDGLQAVFRYRDGQTDDAALTAAVMRSAQLLGAELACPAEFVSAVRVGDGYRVEYTAAGREHECQCRALVNAAGPWVGQVLKSVAPAPPRLEVDLVQGTHIVLEGAPRRGIYYTEAPRDRRVVFIMPWQGHTLVGTTETAYAGDPAAVHPLAVEIDYLRETLLRYFPGFSGRLVTSFAGLRVLPKGGGGAFHRPRETMFMTDDARTPRLVSIYGGKLTGYRITAQKVMGLLQAALPARDAVADTARLSLTPG